VSVAVTALEAALVARLDRRDYLRPYGRAAELFARCPACERGGPNRLALTVRLDCHVRQAIECRNGCSMQRIGAALGVDLAILAEKPHGRPEKPHAPPPKARSDKPRARPEKPHAPPSKARPEKSHGLADRGRPAVSDTGSTSCFSEDEALSRSDDELPVPARSDVDALGRCEEAVHRGLARLGIENPSRNFPCPLPGHSGHASLHRHGESSFKIRCWCEYDRKPSWWSLAEVRASGSYGEPTRLNSPQACVWYRRLFYEADLIVPADVPLPAWPDASPAHRRVHVGLQLLFGLRWLTHGGEAAPFARSFAAPWCGVASSTVALAIAAMRSAGVIVEV